MPRYSVEVTKEQQRELKKMAKLEDRTIASMLRCIVARVLDNPHVGISASIQRQNSANMRHFSAETASFPQSPDPARASTKQIPEKRSLISKEVARPEHGFENFTAELQACLNAVGCDHHLHDQAAIRAVYDRMNPPSPALGEPATESQIREFVGAKARELGGTDYTSGLVLAKLLDGRFWGRRGTLGAKDRGKEARARSESKERRKAEEGRRRSEADQESRELRERGPRLPAAELAKRARALSDSLAKAGPMSPELESIAARVADRERDN